MRKRSSKLRNLLLSLPTQRSSRKCGRNPQAVELGAVRAVRGPELPLGRSPSACGLPWGLAACGAQLCVLQPTSCAPAGEGGPLNAREGSVSVQECCSCGVRRQRQGCGNAKSRHKESSLEVSCCSCVWLLLNLVFQSLS